MATRVRWYILGLLVRPVAIWPESPWPRSGRNLSVHLEMFALLPLFLVANLGEEIGWRGYALPNCNAVSPLTSSLILGVAGRPSIGSPLRKTRATLGFMSRLAASP